jgi:signal transduction histidine kinase
MPAPADAAASEALTELLGVLGRNAGLLFELTAPAADGFGMTATVGNVGPFDPPPRFGEGSLLPRWLRVNRQALPVPDHGGVFDALPLSEQVTLRRLAVTAAVPLIVDDRLVAWAGLSDAPAGQPLTGALPPEVQGIAGRLLSARTAAQERARTEGIAHTNKLSLTGQMAAGIAHEVRNPLAAIRSIVQLVRQEAVPPSEHGRLLDNVVSEIDRVSRVVTDLMMLGRATGSRDEPIELMALVGDAVEFCRPYARQHGLKLEVATATRLSVRGDPHELRQVIVNLLLNACQASRQGQTVVARLKPQTEPSGRPAAIIEVVDQGEGMSGAVLADVFKPFFTTKVNGGGLGLTLCRETMARMGGSIVVSSEPGVGTTVTLSFPQ